jgi:hypothetical protein
MQNPSATSAPSTTSPPPILVATRKGAWLVHGDTARRRWRLDGPHFLGHIINHLVLDPRDGRTLLAAAKTGHLGPTVFRSTQEAIGLETDLLRQWENGPYSPVSSLHRTTMRLENGQICPRFPTWLVTIAQVR